MKLSSNIRFFSLALVIAAAATACGTTAETSADSQSMQRDLESARQLVVKCDGSNTAEDQLARELSKTCRQQNAELRAKGFAACAEDYCSDVLTISHDPHGLDVQVQADNLGFEFSVLLSKDFSLATKEQNSLICYAPVLKARELLTSLSGRCN